MPPKQNTSAKLDKKAALEMRKNAYQEPGWSGYRNMYGAPEFSYKDYFGGINTIAALQLMPEEIPWLSQVPKDPEPKDAVLYLGCNAIRTPHLVLAAVDVLKAMNIDFVTLGGPANCCSIVHTLHGDHEDAERVSESANEKIMRFQPKDVLTICPNCNYTYEHVVTKTQDVPFEMVHFYEFVHANLDKLKFDKPFEKRVGFHRHLGHSHDQELHGDLCAEILDAIPGVEVVELPTYGELGALCTLRKSMDITDERYEEVMKGLFAAAADAECDLMGVIYHSCQRELCAQEFRAPEVSVKSVYEITAEAFGFHHEDKVARFRKIGDVDAILKEVAPNMEAHRISPEAARAALAPLVG